MRRAASHRVSSLSGQAESPLLPVESRLPAAVTLTVCAAVTLLLGVVVHGHATADGLDRTIDRWLHHSIGRHRGILNLVSLLGAPISVTVLASALVVACLVTR